MNEGKKFGQACAPRVLITIDEKQERLVTRTFGTTRVLPLFVSQQKTALRRGNDVVA